MACHQVPLISAVINGTGYVARYFYIFTYKNAVKKNSKLNFVCVPYDWPAAINKIPVMDAEITALEEIELNQISRWKLKPHQQKDGRVCQRRNWKS